MNTISSTGTAARYAVTRDGETVAQFDLAADAWAYVLRVQGQSVHYAVTWGGWDIISPTGASLAADYAGE